jgi:hypothetical protein
MIEKVWQLIECDRRMTIVELKQEVDISQGSIHAILTDDLKMRRVSAITHRATHRLLCSNSSPRKAFLSSPNHRTLRISLRVTFGWKWASRGRISQPWRTSNRMRRPNSRTFQMKPSTGASNNGSIVGASVCVCTRVLLWRWLGKRCRMSYHYSAIPHFRELFDCPS